MGHRALLLLAFLSVTASARETKPSKISFYGKQGGALFDLIAKPTKVRQFHLVVNGAKVGATQKQLGDRWECTIHGKEEAFPKESSESQLMLCTVMSESLEVIVSEDPGGSVSFEGKTGAELFDLIPGEGTTLHSSFQKVTVTQKRHGEAGMDGFFCQRNVPDDAAAKTTYGCHISWTK